MLIIPSIDIYKNKVVRLQKGDFNSLTFYKYSALEMAKKYEQFGFKIVHIVDLLGSKTGNISILKLIEKIKNNTRLKIQFGGGVRNENSFNKLISAGADKIIIGSLSVKDKPEFEIIVNKFSKNKIIVSIDAENEKLKINGWTVNTDIPVTEHIKYCRGLGINKFLCTDISKDGMLSGTNINLYKKLLKEHPSIELIASGGVKDLEEITQLNNLGLSAIIVGKAIYEEKINLKELANFVV